MTRLPQLLERIKQQLTNTEETNIKEHIRQQKFIENNELEIEEQ